MVKKPVTSKNVSLSIMEDLQYNLSRPVVRYFLTGSHFDSTGEKFLIPGRKFAQGRKWGRKTRILKFYFSSSVRPGIFSD